MIDYARPHEPSMYLPPPPPDHSPLDNFNTIKKKWTVSYSYNNYYSTPTYDTYAEPDIAAATNVYHNLLNARDCSNRDAWRYRYVVDWTEDDTVAWVLETLRYNGISEYDFPFCSLRIPGIALRGMKREQVVQALSHPTADPIMCHKTGDLLFEKLQQRLHEEMAGDSSSLRYVEYDQYQHTQAQPEPQTMLDLDSVENKNRLYAQEYVPEETNNVMQTACDSSDDAEDFFRTSETGSPACSYGSDGSKSGDEDDKKKVMKRPPGRPRGSGRNVSKRPRSVSVPEFLRNLLHDPEYCPFIIKWEDYSQGKFRFVKPDEVAKLWGQLKQNDNMTFEKFSRAMRYHYRQAVLVSVPSARLVYQFGHKGPDYRTDNPNFVNHKVKAENHV